MQGAEAKQSMLGNIHLLQPDLLRVGILSQLCWLLCSEWPLISCPAYLNWQQQLLHPIREAGCLPRLFFSGPGLELAEAGDTTPRAKTLQKPKLSWPGLSSMIKGKDAGTAFILKNCLLGDIRQEG